MLKKIFCAAFLCAAIIFIGDAKVFAQDVWIFTDTRINIEYYVMTETIVARKKYDMHCDANVKYVRNGALLTTKKYSFDGHDLTWYSVDGSEQRPVFNLEGRYREQPAFSIYEYCADYIKKHFGVIFTTGPG